jgi:hypothetical protein
VEPPELQFGFVPSKVVDDLHDIGNWKVNLPHPHTQLRRVLHDAVPHRASRPSQQRGHWWHFDVRSCCLCTARHLKHSSTT